MTDKIVTLHEQDGVIYASSRDVVRNFDKEHRHVLRAIENLLQTLSPILAARWFRKGEYYEQAVNRLGRSLDCYDMTRQGFSLLVMGFTGRDAMAWKVAYILKFDEMEGKLGAGARTEALWDRSKRNNVVGFAGPARPQGDLFAPTPHICEFTKYQARQKQQIRALTGRGNAKYNDDDDEDDALARKVWLDGGTDPIPAQFLLFREQWQEQYADVTAEATLRCDQAGDPFILRVIPTSRPAGGMIRLFLPGERKQLLLCMDATIPRPMIDSALTHLDALTPMIRATLDQLFD